MDRNVNQLAFLVMILLLPGCAAIPFEFVKARTVEEVQEDRNCGHDVIENYGCWRSLSAAGGCKIVVEWPHHTGDTERLTTLGKEVMKCVDSNKEP